MILGIYSSHKTLHKPATIGEVVSFEVKCATLDLELKFLDPLQNEKMREIIYNPKMG